VSVDLDINESLIVINAIAVKRAALRGGLWSAVGKEVEKPLLITLCKLFSVPEVHYRQLISPISIREVDLHLEGTESNIKYRCEIKLMGKGNPESADAVFARDTNIFIADKLSDLNKKQLTNNKIEWIELRGEKGYKKFYTVLKKFKIPCEPLRSDLDKSLNEVLKDL